jgi:hypothetical protein
MPGYRSSSTGERRKHLIEIKQREREADWLSMRAYAARVRAKMTIEQPIIAHAQPIAGR